MCNPEKFAKVVGRSGHVPAWRRFGQPSGSSMAWAGTPKPPKKEAFYRDYEYTEEEVLPWHEKPDCYHEDKRGIPSALLQIMVAARWDGPL